jgi:hypothetical protein
LFAALQHGPVTAWLSGLPWWLVAGLVLGVAFTVLAAGLFYVGTRLFPDPERDPRRSGDARRRAEIREYLDALGERYAEHHPVGGRPVAFYLPERDVAITFDARAYFRIDNTDTAAVLVEHELPGAALGARLPFETPDATPEGGPAGGRERRLDGGDRLLVDGFATDDEEPVAPVETAFAELGLPTDADLPDVKAAYRRKVKEVHPDQGGDPDEFQRVREAYTVAKDEAR